MSFVAYTTRHGSIELLGPVRETREEIEQVVEDYKRQGWDNEARGLHATWVQLGTGGPWIVSYPKPKRWWRR